MSRNLTLGLLLAIILANVALAGMYATGTPYRQAGVLLSYGHSKANDIGAPDERQHVNYVIHLLEGKGFPVFNPEDPNLYETYQSHQPPAFYLLEAAWCKALGVSDPANSTEGVK